MGSELSFSEATGDFGLEFNDELSGIPNTDCSVYEDDAIVAKDGDIIVDSADVDTPMFSSSSFFTDASLGFFWIKSSDLVRGFLERPSLTLFRRSLKEPITMALLGSLLPEVGVEAAGAEALACRVLRNLVGDLPLVVGGKLGSCSDAGLSSPAMPI